MHHIEKFKVYYCWSCQHLSLIAHQSNNIFLKSKQNKETWLF